MVLVDRPLVVGHRGNTERILRRYLEDGADIVEVDAFYYKGAFYLRHGPSPIRRPSLQGRIMAWIDYRFFYRDPLIRPLSLRRAAEIVDGRADLMIDVKQRGVARRLIECIEGLEFRGRIYVTSELHPEIRAVKRMFPEAVTIASVNIYPIDVVDLVLKAEADMASVNLGLLDGDMVDRLHENGLGVVVWTVNQASDAKRFADMGVDAIVTDSPKIVSWALESWVRGV